MIDNLKSQEELEVKKLKVTKADIVVKGNVDKPYYVIVYHEVGKDYDNEGFGSYYLENVFKWREENLEIVDENEQPQADKWIPYTTNCELPYNGQKVWISFSNEICSYVKQAWWIYDHFEWNNGKRVKDYPIAWQPFIVPQPYKKEGAE